jgi:hypothetical protein
MSYRLSILTFIAILAFAGTGAAESTGTVVSTIDADSYTYVEIDIDGHSVWFAAPALELNTGEKVIAPAGMAMKDFHSKTLDRTFDVVYFVDAIPLADASEKSAALPAGHPPIQAGEAPSPTSFDFSTIEKPEGGKTVAEVYQESEALAESPVVVRGKVVKVANGIMGKNWIHLQDGTGKAGTDDLTVTTLDTVKAGDTVTAAGVLATNLDFGSGYKYAVLLQDAAVQAE